MTGFLHEREFSRKSFVKGGGALIVGFGVGGALAGTASAAAPTAAGYLPDSGQLDSWLRVNADNTVNLKTSQIEVGNGITTGFLMVAAEELDLDMSQMIYGTSSQTSAGAANTVVDSYVTLSTGGEGGSQAMHRTGPQIRAAAAAARQALMGLAAKQLGVPAASLSVSKGVVSGGGKSVTYGELVGGKLFGVKLTKSTLEPGASPAKPISQYSLVTTRAPRIDVPDKMSGVYTYVHAIRLPGMLHGRWVRPRGQGPYATDGFAKPVSVDASSVSHIPNVTVVHEGDFVGVVAPKEYDAIQAAAQLKVTWAQTPILSGHANVIEYYRASDTAGKTPAKYTANVGNVDTAMKSAAKTVSASFYAPHRGHNPIGPGCCVADYRAGSPSTVTVFSNTQNVENLVVDLSETLNLDPANVRVLFYEGASSFGNGWHAFDIAEAATVMSRAVGKPVRLQLMRWDEQGWTHYGQAYLTDMRGGVDAKGNIVAYEATQFDQPGTRQMPTRIFLGEKVAPLGTGNTNTENLGPMYKVSTQNYRLIAKTIPQPLGVFQSGPLRAPSGPQTAFASEQFIDMLAETAGMDPLSFRVQNMRTDGDNPRWTAVLQAAVNASGYQAHVPASQLGGGNIVTGWGMAIGSHHEPWAGTVAHVQVNKSTGKVTVMELWSGQDSGLTVNPSLVENQMSGNLIQGTSIALNEELRFSKERVTSTDWVTYPILRFKDAPKVNTIVVQRLDQPSVGSGEPPIVSVAASIANAVYDATGVRMLRLPLTPARVRDTLKAAGQG